MIEAFFNTKIRTNHPNKLRKLGEDYFEPIRYLFNGRKVSIYGGIKLEEHLEFTQKKSCKKTIVAILLLVPKFFAGLVASLLSLKDPNVRKDIHVAQATSFDKDQCKLEAKAQNLRAKMKDKSCWKDPQFQKEIDLFMKEAYKQMRFLFRDLRRRAKGDPKIMAQMLQEQCPLPGFPNYCFSFFYNSLTQMYHVARGCATVALDPDRPKVFHLNFDKNLKAEDISPYFTQGTLQSKWREMYNSFCSFMDDNLKKELRDKRFLDWMNSDNDRTVKSFGFPGGMPTPPIIPDDAFPT